MDRFSADILRRNFSRCKEKKVLTPVEKHVCDDFYDVGFSYASRSGDKIIGPFDTIVPTHIHGNGRKRTILVMW